MRTNLVGICCLLLCGCITTLPRQSLNGNGRRSTLPGRRMIAHSSIEPVRATNPDRAHKWRSLRWQDEFGRIPEDALRRAVAHRQESLARAAIGDSTRVAGIDPAQWVHRGPVNVGGRTRSLLIDPGDPLRMWAGAVSGGIWHSADGGESWSPADDRLPSLAICCLATDPNDPRTMYAGTGEGFFNGDALGGAGIYKSTDGAETWLQLPATADWDNVNRISVSTRLSRVVLAARRYGGIQRSIDGGQTWSNPLWAQGSFQVAFDPNDGSKAIAHIIDFDWDEGDWYHRAVFSTNYGYSWQTAAGLDYIPGFNSRIELAYSPSQPNLVYASCAADGGKIWRSTDGGQSYTLRTSGGSSSGVNWYANPLWVDPTDSDVLVTGGYDLYKSTDGGANLVRISSGYIMTTQPHVDMHYVVSDPGFDAATNRRVYVCTDGGVWKTDDIYTTSTAGGWEPVDKTYVTTQFYGAAGDGPSGTILGGTQDNGTLRLLSGSSDANLTFGGDGGFCAIDPTDPNYCYGEYVGLQIHRSTDGGQTAHYIYDGIADAGVDANFIAPFILDPNDTDTMLAGGASLWRSVNVKAPQPAWQAIRPPGSDRISAMAVAPGHSNVIWVGQNNGEVHRTTDGMGHVPTWFAVDSNEGPDPLPNRFVERIVIDPADSSTVYIALGGFSTDNLWRTIDGGESWYDITGEGPAGLPGAPINGLARHPLHRDWLYVGTEVGIFATVDGGLTWSAVNEGPTNASVDELVFMNNSFTLLAATHGRGIFTIDVLGVSYLDIDGDGVVDLDDYARLPECMAGPAAPPAPTPPMTTELCLTAYDSDGDADVDLADYSAFQVASGDVRSRSLLARPDLQQIPSHLRAATPLHVGEAHDIVGVTLQASATIHEQSWQNR